MAGLEYWLWLSTAGVSARARSALLARYGDAETACLAPEGSFSSVPGLGAREAAVLERRDLSGAAAVSAACAEQGIRIVTMQDAAYPLRLRSIYAPPPVLYVKGDLPVVDEEAAIAVIGTRRASPYGLKMGRDLAWQICKGGGLVISLLTGGIDAAAARGALLAGGPILGVLGTPHEAETSRLAEDVAANGALISEYAPGTRPLKSFFRERNRVAAGLSVGVVVVEAPEKSGTRLFADEAADMGREIFAVPGNADAANSAGTLALLKEGAVLATRGQDVLREFQALYPDKIHLEDTGAAPEETKPRDRSEALPAAEKDVDSEKPGGYIDLREQLAGLSGEQLSILTAIDKNAVHIDDIIEATGLPTAKVLAQLTLLEIKGYVRREAGRRISLNITKK